MFTTTLPNSIYCCNLSSEDVWMACFFKTAGVSSNFIWLLNLKFSRFYFLRTSINFDQWSPKRKNVQLSRPNCGIYIYKKDRYTRHFIYVPNLYKTLMLYINFVYKLQILRVVQMIKRHYLNICSFLWLKIYLSFITLMILYYDCDHLWFSF